MTFRELHRHHRTMCEHMGIPPDLFPVFVVGYLLERLRLRPLRCRLLGHDLVDTSHGGPDGGYEEAHCSRCGYGYHVRMY